MPQFSEKELEQQLAGAGESLAQPPSSVDDLLQLLDKIESLLAKVEQSPAKSMQNAFSPLMKALVMESLLKHSDVDVKVGVASCISEITRITAPDAPYDDDKMKDVFQLIVSSFEKLSDVSSRSYDKRATILVTVAKVRSCVIMLDLECDQMIVEMFQHFLKAIREDHAALIFTSMETIMTLVLEESEDISPELLAPILATLKRNDEAAMPTAKKLAEQVLQKSADKLRPYLRQAVKSLDTSLDDYNEVVSCVCGENTDVVGNSNESVLNDQPVVEGKCTSASPAQDSATQAGKDGSEETNNIQGEEPTMSVVSNGGIKEENKKEIMVDANSPKRADSNSQLDAKSSIKIESDDCPAADKPVNTEEKPEAVESQQVLKNHEIPNKDVHLSPPTEVKPTVEASNTEDKVEESVIEHSPSEKDPVVVALPIQGGSHPDESPSKSDILGKGKDSLASEEIVSDTATKKTTEGESVAEAKKKQHLCKKRTDDSADNDKTLTEEVVSKNDDENLAIEEMVSEIASKKVFEGESISEAKKKRCSGKKQTDDSAEVVSEKDDEGQSESDILTKGKGNKDMVSETASKKASEDEPISEARKKRRSGKKQTDDSADNDKTLPEEVVSKKDDEGQSESGILAKGKGREEMASETASKKASEDEPISEAKKKRRLGKKKTDDSADNDKTLTEEVLSKNDDVASDSVARSLDQTEKTVDKKESKSSLRKEDGKKSGRAKPASEKDVRRSSAKEDHGKDIVTSRKSPLKSTKSDGTQEENPKTSNKRKQTPGKEKASESLDYGENLVGARVKVWWPKDRMFYDGEIAAFDSAKKKHKVLYTDGDEEVLNLKKERWEFLEGDKVSDGDQEVEHSSQDTSSDMKRKKKRNANSETSSKRQKVVGSPKSKPPKSGGKSKDDGKAESESKDNYSKPGKKSESDGSSIKSKDQSQKLGGKGQVDTPAKATSKSKDEVAKQDSQKSSISKGKTPQSSKVTKSGSSKEKTGECAKSTETAKGKSPDAAKSRESEAKSGKKRRR